MSSITQALSVDSKVEPKCPLKPLPDRIIVRIDGFHYSGRLVIPDTAKRLPTTGHVIAIGSSVTQVSVGDRVVFPLYSGTLIKFKNFPKYRVLTEPEILALVDTDEQLDLEDMGT